MKKILSEIGEYQLHDWIFNFLSSGGDSEEFFGEDTVDFGSHSKKDESVNIISMDRGARVGMNEFAAKLCVTQNFSDIICSGGEPTGFLFGAFLPRTMEFSIFKKIFKAANEEVKRYNARMFGGDLKEDDQARLVGVALGQAKPQERLYFRGAIDGDIVAVTKRKNNPIGFRWAYVLIEKLKLDVDDLFQKKCEREHSSLDLPINEMRVIRRFDGITSSNDLSDGLGAAFLRHSKVNDIGFEIFEESLLKWVDPELIKIAEHLKIELVNFGFSPGYMWENILTISPDCFDDIKSAVENSAGELIQIGVTNNKKNNFSLINGVKKRTIIPFSDENFREYKWDNRADQWLNHKHLI